MRKVFGIGLNKTGTKTLGAALRLLGRRHVSIRGDLLMAYRQGDLATVFAVCDANDSFEDWPFPLMYRELYERYGDTARYVLTVRRSPEVWLASLKNHALTTPVKGHSRLLAYGHAYPHGLEEEHLAIYRDHNRAVLDFFAERGASHLVRQFCWETGDGWDALCGLGEPVPQVPFPRENVTRRDRLAASRNYAGNRRAIARQLADLGREPGGEF
jgi:hypothetical protein